MPGNTVGPLRLTADGDPFSADVHDISIIGVGLIVDLPYSLGRSFTVVGGPKGWRLARPLESELRHVTQRDDGRWLLGCSFSRHLTSDDVEILG